MQKHSIFTSFPLVPQNPGPAIIRQTKRRCSHLALLAALIGISCCVCMGKPASPAATTAEEIEEARQQWVEWFKEARYGYNKNDPKRVESGEIVNRLADIVSKGGNYLLNFGLRRHLPRDLHRATPEGGGVDGDQRRGHPERISMATAW